MKITRKSYTKFALTLSVILLLMWILLGAGTSLAWFTDTTPVQKNVFFVGELDLEVYHLDEGGKYERVTSETAIFDDDALYEPGYVQVVRLKICNEGDVPFDWRLAVGVNDFVPAINVFGQTFNLQDYLKFGVVTADSEDELDSKLSHRTASENIAVCDIPLSTYSTESQQLDAGGETFVALIVCMPESVGNVANNNGKGSPQVELGLVFKATQQGIPD